MKVSLQPPPKEFHADRCSTVTPLVKSLPFFRSAQGQLTHRIRWGRIYWRDGEYHHTALYYWCGNIGFLDRGKLSVHASVPECLTCKLRYHANK